MGRPRYTIRGDDLGAAVRSHAVITRLEIENFKAIKKVAIELDPLTVLVGPNDSGKSTILQALDLLSRSLDRPTYRPGEASVFDRELTLRFVEVSEGDLRRLADEQLEKNEAGGEVLQLASKVASSWRDIRCGQIMRQTEIS